MCMENLPQTSTVLYIWKLNYFCSPVSGGPWIGFHDPDENDTFVWLNGNPLPNDDENWKDN